MPENQFYLSIQGRNIPLIYSTQLTQTDIPELQPQNYDGVIAQVNPNPQNPAILGLKNCSAQTWVAALPNGEIRQIQTGQSIKLEENTQINFGSVHGTIASQRLTNNFSSYSTSQENNQQNFYEISSDDDIEQDHQKKITPKAIAIVFVIALILTSLILIASLFQNKNSEYTPPTGTTTEKDTCNGLTTRRKALGISNWDEVNKRFWTETDYPDGQQLETNHPNYDYYHKRWCEIADRWLSEKESQTENLVTRLSDEEKAWQGYFYSKEASLKLDSYELSEDRKVANFTGKLTVSQPNNGSSIISVKGEIESETQKISFQETELIDKPSNGIWYLGTNQGTISADLFSMSGNGSDTNGNNYLWCLDHINARKTCTK